MVDNRDKYPNPLERIWYGASSTMVKLTKRETEIVRLIARGLRNADISVALDRSIAARGVESHVRNILCKVGLESRTQICAWALKHHLVELEDL